VRLDAGGQHSPDRIVSEPGAHDVDADLDVKFLGPRVVMRSTLSYTDFHRSLEI
jgi:hypothetical protein